MANYVKFQRGNFDAFKLLKENNNLDRNTLYFIMVVLAAAAIIFTITGIRARRKLEKEFNRKFH